MTRLPGPLLAFLILLPGCLDSDSPVAPTDRSSDRGGGLAGDGAAAGFVDASALVQTQTVCFTGDFTRNQMPHVDVVMTGTLFRPVNLTDHTRAVVLVHGFASTAARTFDGGADAFGVANQTTLARALAAAGYAVFAADRLGMGVNPYPDGRKLTIESYVELTSHIVAQVKAGTYRTSAAGCPADGPAPFKAAGVVIGGHSFGALVAQNYFQLSDEAEALVSLDIVHALSPAIVAAWSDCFSRAVLADPASGYWESACTREYCFSLFFNAPGYHAASAESWCDPALQVADTQGSLSDTQYNVATTAERLLRGGPVFLLYAECAAFSTLPCDPTAREMETQSWEGMCPDCDVTEHVLPGVAHAYMYYPAANLEANRVILDWLMASALGPTTA